MGVLRCQPRREADAAVVVEQRGLRLCRASDDGSQQAERSAEVVVHGINVVGAADEDNVGAGAGWS